MDYLEKYTSLWTSNKGLKSNIELNTVIEQLKQDKYLQLSPATHYLLDYRNKKYIFISESVINLFGYSAEELKKGGVEMQFKLMHPDDAKIHLDFSLKQFKNFLRNIPKEELSKYKFSYNYRMKRKDGMYFHMLQEFVILEKDEDDLPLFNFGYATDISNHKSNNKISFKVSKYKEGLGFIELKKEFYPGHILTNKEIEVIQLINQGKTSKEIADITFNSIETIKSHRKNILKKLNLNKFQKAINYCKEIGIIN
ncbi:MAG: LuxR C-terminal-related transcriptional regulator [Bacteroidia bacterium]